MIQSLVERKKAFKNQSGFVRSAVNHYLNSAEAGLDLDDDVDSSAYTVNGQVMLSFKKGENEHRVLKDMFACEAKYQDEIATFEMNSTSMNSNSCIYSFKGSIFNFRSFVDDLDSIPELTQLRYLICE